MSLRDEHFKRINSYHQSLEYAEFCKTIGTTPPFACTESLLGKRWAIDERLYNEFLNILPPMNWRSGSFMMSEYTFSTITTKYSKVGDRYYCEFVDTAVKS